MKPLRVLLYGGILAASLVAANQNDDPPVFLLKWGGTAGSSPGHFEQAIGVATDPAGNVYVVDQFNHRVQKFTNNGTFPREIGSPRTGPGQLLTPAGIAVSAAGTVYVTELSNSRVSAFTTDGLFVTSWADGLNMPEVVAAGPDGNAYVAAGVNDRVRKFTPTGILLLSWGSGGSGPGQFRRATGIAADTQGFRGTSLGHEATTSRSIPTATSAFRSSPRSSPQHDPPPGAPSRRGSDESARHVARRRPAAISRGRRLDRSAMKRIRSRRTRSAHSVASLLSYERSAKRAAVERLLEEWLSVHRARAAPRRLT